MNRIFKINCISIVLLFILIATPSAGCLCVDTECCFISLSAGGSPNILAIGPGDCDCAIYRCSQISQDLAPHQHSNAVNSVLRIVAQQAHINWLYAHSFFTQPIHDSPVPQLSITHKSSSFLYSTKTVSLLI